ncbi:acyltransferase [Acinetobacter schindleri]|nr:acyltransferase [Acinetobacter schindleri]
MSNLKQFRYDINGLRAYAVGLVVLFHFQVLGFSAGFIGVDVFFVISGYLMSKIIIDQLLQERFSIWKFYLARGIRILPALLALTVVVGIVGWFLLIPEEYKNYGKHAASSITFLSNILYLRESSDYFSAAAHEKILLHTWSLSVEWQFYIILPIILLIIGKIKKSRTILNSTILVGFIISLILSYKVSQSNQTTAFYMIPTRAWEMLAGGLVYAYLSQISLSDYLRKAIEISGFGLIVLSLFIFKTDTLWPSINAILPVLGSMLILMANCNDSILTKPKIFQWTGNASYSIYLWHWPIVFFIGYLGYKDNSGIIIGGIILSLILGWISFKFIETPTRKYLSKISVLKSYSILILVTAVLTAVFALIFIKNGIPERANERYLESAKKVAMPLPTNGWCFYSVGSIGSLQIGEKVLDCKIGAKENIKHTALLFGDSFAGHNIPFWNDVGNKLDTQVQAVTTNWCYPGANSNMRCDSFKSHMIINKLSKFL